MKRFLEVPYVKDHAPIERERNNSVTSVITFGDSPVANGDLLPTYRIVPGPTVDTTKRGIRIPSRGEVFGLSVAFNQVPTTGNLWFTVYIDGSPHPPDVWFHAEDEATRAYRLDGFGFEANSILNVKYQARNITDANLSFVLELWLRLYL